jgi:hypothetical protein
MENLFKLSMGEGSSSWHLGADGNWLKNGGRDQVGLLDVQDQLMLNAQRAGNNH